MLPHAKQIIGIDMYGNLMRISSEANVIFDEATVTFLTPQLSLEIINGILTVNNTHQKKN